MKTFRHLLLILAVFGSSLLFAQNDNVGIGTAKPDQSSILDLNSSKKGLLIPRMTLSDRNNISMPAKGLLIYQTDQNAGFQYFDGLEWKPLNRDEEKSLASSAAMSGTLNYIPKFTGASTIDNSGIFEDGAGNVGIGTSTIPAFAKLQVQGNLITNGSIFMNGTSAALTMNALSAGSQGRFDFNDGGVPKFQIYHTFGQNGLGIWDIVGAKDLLLFDAGVANFNNSIKVNTNTGFLAIGNFSPGTPLPTPAGYRLIVQDGILTEKVKVALKSSVADWADYVFEPEYKTNMMTLDEVEQFTLKNKHLPNVPSADNMVSEGLDIAKTSKMFMEKIEELTLYLIELNKEVKALKVENQLLRNK
ncbi:hypothetical protein [Lacihabitans soyangensis]|jgi:hypothetical protein|uniref:Peptidase S74 domain-containing protein n=1 Tax=Lacihabitans soyangensis TaxID=869394 RepID=A0AAE3H0Z9_9BACT|nr:hypothetical protein [Lacihabitans soyangensis]MCP9762913.1 hypothetical protein [Lacihabitans soyangensis]